MTILQFKRGEFSGVLQALAKQKSVSSDVLSEVRSYVPQIQQSWIGGDAQAFEGHVVGNLVPALAELIAALAGIDLNLRSGEETIDQADRQVKSHVDKLASSFKFY